MKYSQSQLAEIKRCKQDFLYFCRYLRIITKKGKLVTFVPNASQMQVLGALQSSNWNYVLKARQVGISTITAAYIFWQVLLTSNFRAAVVAHRQLSAQHIFRIYTTFLKNLPAFLKFPCNTNNVSEIVFNHGSSIKVSSGGSKGLQGTTLNAIHATEFSEYDNIPAAMASIFPAVPPDSGQLIIETTANGLNQAYQIWIDQQSGFNHVFIPWTLDADYVTDKPIAEFSANENSYANTWSLSRKQKNWMQHVLRTGCGNDPNVFNEMYPISAEIAFITSGTKFFSNIFHGLDVAQASADEGLKMYTQPQEFSRCLMGVDVATGQANGDYHAITIIDYTNTNKMHVVATLRMRCEIHEFAEHVLNLALQYRAFITVERNMGIPVLEFLKAENYPWLYRKVTFAKSLNTFTEALGFATTQATRPYMLSRLQEYVSLQRLDVVCPRIKNEMNSFCYTNNTSRPEAAHGAHDDLVFSTALALMGLDQTSNSYEENMFQLQRPRTQEQVIYWEIKNKMAYNTARDADFWDDPIESQQEMTLSDLR